MSDLVKVAFASGSPDLNPELIDRIAELYPELPLYVVGEFPPHRGEWIPYHPYRTLRENMAACRAALAGKRIRLAAVLLVPRVPYRRMRLMALMLSVRGFLAYNEHFGSFMLRPRSAGNILRHGFWRVQNFFRWHFRKDKAKWNPARISGPIAFAIRPAAALPDAPQSEALPPGVSVVIPSRNGLALLREMLPALLQERPSETIVVDNGSDDGTVDSFPDLLMERSVEPLSFAAAVNRGLARVQYSHTLLLNNDMLVRAGFLRALKDAFDATPDLFCATAQIFFPEGMRREETGKAVLRLTASKDFPVRCEEPIAGEDGTWVLYGSGGCSLYDTRKLRALHGVNPIYEPAYVEDLDLGYRAWVRGWPSVFVSGAHVEHRHRSTTSRYYTAAEIDVMVERNYLRFVASALRSPKIWRQAIDRVTVPGAWKIPWSVPAAPRSQRMHAILAITGGDVAVFPARARSGRPVVLIATSYLPFPLAHGGAVRMFNLISRAAADFDQVIVAFCDELRMPPAELLDVCNEIILVRRAGTHYRKSSTRPDTVEEFDSLAFHEALRLTAAKWKPEIAQLEFTQMAQYAADCAPAKTILVEHDITFDLQEQLAKTNPTWEVTRQLPRWRNFETAAWNDVDCVVTMSEKDRAAVGDKAVLLPNGVDLARYRPCVNPPEPGRILFIGSFAHLPNLLAVDWFLREVWPMLGGATLHVIAGSRHDYYMDFYRTRIAGTGIEIKGFVSDVRPAYERASVVIAPLTASAGTNIKILEAMATGKAIVSTAAGINGLDLVADQDLLIANDAASFAAAVRRCLDDSEERSRLEKAARATVAANYDWDRIAKRQRDLYNHLITPKSRKPLIAN